MTSPDQSEAQCSYINQCRILPDFKLFFTPVLQSASKAHTLILITDCTSHSRKQIEWLTQCGAGKKTARRYMSNAFSLSSKGSGCLIFAPNYLTNCVTYYGAKIIHQDSFEDCKKVLDIKRRTVFLPAPHCVNHSRYAGEVCIMKFPA